MAAPLDHLPIFTGAYAIQLSVTYWEVHSRALMYESANGSPAESAGMLKGQILKL